jgi:hypothetical protein
LGFRAAAAGAEGLSELGVWDRAGGAAEWVAYRYYARRPGALGRHHDGLG